MKINSLLFVMLAISLQVYSQQITGKELLEKAILYHDPHNNWQDFEGTLDITMQIPNKLPRQSFITIDLPNQYFKSITKRDSLKIEMIISKKACSFALNDSENISEVDLKKYNLNCKRAELLKNYYTYLYGLPMKLRDPGTIIHPNVKRKSFKGKDYLVLRVTYNSEVGNDIWYFYFNPETYAMEVYQFYKTDKNSVQENNSGEYILLTEEELVNGIRMPKNRAWYYNKNDQLLGTDILN
ncbi:DUF6503 family protein [Seonamhaeicola sp. ML3]|uniref:DUF6503 family protein n=1 Tax=Seonamhaeicola sp. ML3 TaxID=2937786 RepID=UPI00200E1884|nr:DUF6503 family protein [Seonamhaeicola sp. ML3]